MSGYRCSAYTAKREQCTYEARSLWKGLIALCDTHRARHGEQVRAIKKAAVAKHYRGAQRRYEETLAARLEKPSHVYFIRAQDAIKIGVSVKPMYRLGQIRTGSSKKPLGLDTSKAEIIATIPGGRNVEQNLHRRFGHLRLTGEWFTATPELTRYIEEVAA